MELRPFTADDFGEPPWEKWGHEGEAFERTSGRGTLGHALHHGGVVVGWLDVTAVVSVFVTLAFVVHWSA
jgi:hypothetical protein